MSNKLIKNSFKVLKKSIRVWKNHSKHFLIKTNLKYPISPMKKLKISAQIPKNNLNHKFSNLRLIQKT